MAHGTGHPTSHPDPRRRFRRADTARLEAFSDGVFAIAVTILVLDLGDPAHGKGHLAGALASHWPAYLGYVASFGLVGVIWLNHHQAFARIRRVDRGLHAANLLLLGISAALAFPTTVLADALRRGSSDTDARTATALYAGIAAMMCATWLHLYHYLQRHPTLLDPNVEAHYVPHGTLRSAIGVICYALAGAIGFFVSPLISMAAFLLLPVFYFLTSEGFSHVPD